MSDLEDIELDATMLHNKAFSIASLELMKGKYNRFPDLTKEIDKQIKEIEENEHNR